MKKSVLQTNKDLDLRRFGRNQYTNAKSQGDGGNSGGSGGDGGDGGGGGGDSTPTEIYIKFKAENFGLRDADYVPDTVDRSKGYRLDEIFDMSDETLERFIKAQENTLDGLISSGYTLNNVKPQMGCNYYHGGNSGNQLNDGLFMYTSYESGEIGSNDGSYPVIYTAFTKYDEQLTAKTFIQIGGTNLKGYSWTPPNIIFERNDEDGLWYIVYAS